MKLAPLPRTNPRLAARNRNSAKRFRVGDEFLTLAEAAARAGLATGTLIGRMRRGRSLAEALAMPAPREDDRA